MHPGSGLWYWKIDYGAASSCRELQARVGSNGRVIGLDPNEERIRTAQDKLITEETRKTVTFLHGMCSDAIGLGPFDAVFSNYVLHWVREHPVIFKQLSGCLKPGGRLVFLTGGGRPPPLMQDVFRIAIGQDCDTALGLSFGSVDYWERQCSNAGLSVEFSEEVVLCPAMPSIEAFFDALTAVSSGVFRSSMLTDHDVGMLLSQYGYRPNSEIAVEMPVVKVLARKPQQFMQ
jgi:SAM-dependent methyltransferase